MDSKELVWTYVMNQAQRFPVGEHRLPICDETFKLVVTDNDTSGISYSVRGRGKFRIFGWKINGVFEPFWPCINAAGSKKRYDELARKIQCQLS